MNNQKINQKFTKFVTNLELQEIKHLQQMTPQKVIQSYPISNLDQLDRLHNQLNDNQIQNKIEYQHDYPHLTSLILHHPEQLAHQLRHDLDQGWLDFNDDYQLSDYFHLYEIN